AGRPLFPEGRTAQKLVWQQIKDPMPVNQVRPEVSPELAAVVHRMLRKKAADRYQTPLGVFDALAPFLPGRGPAPDRDWLPEMPGRVASAKSHASGPAGPRSSSSVSSRIVAAALRTGSSGSRRELPPAGTTADESTDEEGKLAITPSPRKDGNT